MNETMRVAVFDDDPTQAAQFSALLTGRTMWPEGGFTCLPFSNWDELRRTLRRETFDVLLVSWADEGIGARKLLKWLREEQQDCTPVLVSHHRASEQDIASALLLGADDFVAPPFRDMELRARLKRLHSGASHAIDATRFNQWRLDRAGQSLVYEAGSVSTHHDRIELTSGEFRLAQTLFRNAGRTLSRSYLIDKAGIEGGNNASRTLDTHVYRLRRKLQRSADQDLALLTVYGTGYRLEIGGVNGAPAQARSL
jgi:DNA-binding response OmpR family regulator